MKQNALRVSVTTLATFLIAAGIAFGASDRNQNQVGRNQSITAKKIIGLDVKNDQGEKLGDVVDLVVDADGRIRFAVVNLGGFLGMGGELHAVPWNSIRQ